MRSPSSPWALRITYGALSPGGAGRDLPTASELFAHKAQTIQAPSFRLCHLSLYDSAQASINWFVYFLPVPGCGRLAGGLRCLPGDRGALSAWLGGPAQLLACHCLGLASRWCPDNNSNDNDSVNHKSYAGLRLLLCEGRNVGPLLRFLPL